jgi:hypothetical protein
LEGGLTGTYRSHKIRIADSGKGEILQDSCYAMTRRVAPTHAENLVVQVRLSTPQRLRKIATSCNLWKSIYSLLGLKPFQRRKRQQRCEKHSSTTRFRREIVKSLNVLFENSKPKLVKFCKHLQLLSNDIVWMLLLPYQLPIKGRWVCTCEAMMFSCEVFNIITAHRSMPSQAKNAEGRHGVDETANMILSHLRHLFWLQVSTAFKGRRLFSR